MIACNETTQNIIMRLLLLDQSCVKRTIVVYVSFPSHLKVSVCECCELDEYGQDEEWNENCHIQSRGNVAVLFGGLKWKST